MSPPEVSPPEMIPPENSFAVFVAIDKYSEAKGGITPDLRAAVNDARAVAKRLIEACGFRKENVFVLADAEATKARIEACFAELATRLEHHTGRKRLWCQFSGHGLPAADDDTRETMFATWETRRNQPHITALHADVIRRCLPKQCDEIILIVDCCHAKGMRNLDLRSEPDKRSRRAVVTTSLEGQLAYELPDGSNSLFVKALLELLDGTPLHNGKLKCEPGALRLGDVEKYLTARLPELASEERPEAVLPQDPDFALHNSSGWALATTDTGWPRLLPNLLVGFDQIEPPATTAEEPWRCLVVLSDSPTQPTLQKLVGDALDLCRVPHLDKTPLVVSASEALASDERFLELIRALCRIPIAVFDVTEFEPAVMLLLGIRSVVRRGVTICSAGGNYKLGAELDFPFNFREVSFAAHSQAQEEPAPPILLRDRLEAGINEIRERPQYYMDLPGYEATRRPVSHKPRKKSKQAKPSIFILCPFGAAYANSNWRRVAESLKAAFAAAHDDDFDVLRMLETESPRLLTQTLYEQIRRARYCVVDLTNFRPNVLLELGVRLAVSQYGADCIMDEAATVSTEQQRRVLERLKVSCYNRSSATSAFLPIARDQERGPTPWFNAIKGWIDADIEVPHLRPDQELQAAAQLLERDEAQQFGEPPLLYPSDELQKRAAEKAYERRLCAWLYLDGRYGPKHLADEKDPSKANDYLKLATLLLAKGEALAEGKRPSQSPRALLERIQEGVAALEAAIAERRAREAAERDSPSPPEAPAPRVLADAVPLASLEPGAAP